MMKTKKKKNKWKIKRDIDDEVEAASGVVGPRFMPEELVMDIIKRLDDPSCLFRLRTLNKSWFRLLSSRKFLHSFLLFNHHDDDHVIGRRRRQIIVMRNKPHLACYPEYDLLPVNYAINGLDVDDWYDNERRKVFSCISYDTLQQTAPTAAFDRNSFPPPIDRYRLGSPLDPKPPDVTIVGSCHGILCLSIRHYGLYSPSDLILWNPTTSETKLLPPFPYPPFVRRRVRLPGPRRGLFRRRFSRQLLMTFDENIGFGFDPTSTDYKIVATVCWDSTHSPLDERYPS